MRREVVFGATGQRVTDIDACARDAAGSPGPGCYSVTLASGGDCAPPPPLASPTSVLAFDGMPPASPLDDWKRQLRRSLVRGALPPRPPSPEEPRASPASPASPARASRGDDDDLLRQLERARALAEAGEGAAAASARDADDEQRRRTLHASATRASSRFVGAPSAPLKSPRASAARTTPSFQVREVGVSSHAAARRAFCDEPAPPSRRRRADDEDAPASAGPKPREMAVWEMRDATRAALRFFS